MLPLVFEHQNVIGYAFAVNGQLNTADIYANENLFSKLWPKILDSASTEAVAEFDKSQNEKIPEPSEVKQWISQINNGKKSTDELHTNLKQDTIEDSESVRFDTYCETEGTKAVYRQNYIKK